MYEKDGVYNRGDGGSYFTFEDENGVLFKQANTPENLIKQGWIELVGSNILGGLSPTRETILIEIKNTKNRLLMPIHAGYGPLDYIKWDKTAEIFKDWSSRVDKNLTINEQSHFDDERGSLTAQQYFEERVVPKVSTSIQWQKIIKGIYTDLVTDLNNTTDDNLITFDYVTMWDDVGDFYSFTPEYVDQSSWSKFITWVFN